MAKKKPHSRKLGSARDSQPARAGASGIRLRRTAAGNAWELVHPRCARDRTEDVEEVRKMVAADEIDIAIDELRWLLNGCGDFIEAHALLGELALGENDFPLARGHFGYAYRLGAQAIKAAGSPTPVPYDVPANQHFFAAGKGLAFCLKQLGKSEMAVDVVEQLLACDPRDPLGVKGLLDAQ